MTEELPLNAIELKDEYFKLCDYDEALSTWEFESSWSIPINNATLV